MCKSVYQSMLTYDSYLCGELVQLSVFCFFLASLSHMYVEAWGDQKLKLIEWNIYLFFLSKPVIFWQILC